MLNNLITILILFGAMLSILFYIDVFITYIVFTFDLFKHIHGVIQVFNRILIGVYLSWVFIMFILIILVAIKDTRKADSQEVNHEHMLR